VLRGKYVRGCIIPGFIYVLCCFSVFRGVLGFLPLLRAHPGKEAPQPPDRCCPAFVASPKPPTPYRASSRHHFLVRSVSSRVFGILGQAAGATGVELPNLQLLCLSVSRRTLCRAVFAGLCVFNTRVLSRVKYPACARYDERDVRLQYACDV